MTKKIVLLASLAFLAASGAFTQITVSGGYALSFTTGVSVDGRKSDVWSGGVGTGGNVYVDYLLPVSIPLSLGFEIGVDGSKLELHDLPGYFNFNGKYTVLAIPLLLRAAYHFDLMAKLDLYAVAKIGYVIGDASSIPGGSNSYYGGLGLGLDAGVAYYFSGRFGAFAELGFDRYYIKGTSLGANVDVPFDRFLTIGVSFKR